MSDLAISISGEVQIKLLMFRYCWFCLAQWKNSNGRTRGDLGTCPECREQVRSETRVIAIEKMIEDDDGTLERKVVDNRCSKRSRK